MKTKFCLSRSAVLLLLSWIPIFSLAQTNISGKVLSKDQIPVAGVSVVVKGRNVGTATAPDGSFTLAANAGDVIRCTT